MRCAPLAPFSLGLLLLAACGDGGADGVAAGAPVDTESVLKAMAACSAGQPALGLVVLDSVLATAAPTADAYAVRGLCQWTRYVADSARADIDGAYADLTASIDAPAGARSIALDQIYSHRAFVTLSRDPTAVDAALADLAAAARAAPDVADHALDRAVLQTTRGDTSAALASLRVFLALADSADGRRQSLARRMLADLGADLGADAGVPPSRP